MTTRNRRSTSASRLGRALGAALLAGGLTAASLGASPSAQAAPAPTAVSPRSGPALADPAQDPGSSAPAPVRPKLRQQLEAKGEATFWVRFDARADLDAASRIADRDARGEAVYEALTRTAVKSQKQVVARLERAGVQFETFHATNAIRVISGSEALAEQLAAQPEVQALYPTRDYAFDEPSKGNDLDEVNSVEWGIAAINADDVWSRYDDTGRGITVANIDTGVQYDHPALVRSYRGNNGDGTFSHDYNWFDAARSCPTAAPCDTNGHGTHTMGTMVGDDEAGNQIGVAPGVRWITANGCCPSDAALLSASQWMLAPTRVDGSDPDPSKRPDIINNSWGSRFPSNDPFLEDLQLAWEASGIFSAVSNGNLGPQCNTSGSPGSRAINYSVGAFDAGGAIAPFSSRGTGQDGAIKPDIAAPGVSVRSSIPGGLYGSYDGTSMAAPHLAGAVALLWSAAPALLGDIQVTRDLLDQTAVDTGDLRCGEPWRTTTSSAKESWMRSPCWTPRRSATSAP